jgi:hypothetical protein
VTSPEKPRNVKRMKRSELALATFIACYEFNPTCRPVFLNVRQLKVLLIEISCLINARRIG